MTLQGPESSPNTAQTTDLGHEALNSELHTQADIQQQDTLPSHTEQHVAIEDPRPDHYVTDEGKLDVGVIKDYTSLAANRLAGVVHTYRAHRAYERQDVLENRAGVYGGLRATAEPVRSRGNLAPNDSIKVVNPDGSVAVNEIPIINPDGTHGGTYSDGSLKVLIGPNNKPLAIADYEQDTLPDGSLRFALDGITPIMRTGGDGNPVPKVGYEYAKNPDGTTQFQADGITPVIKTDAKGNYLTRQAPKPSQPSKPATRKERKAALKVEDKLQDRTNKTTRMERELRNSGAKYGNVVGKRSWFKTKQRRHQVKQDYRRGNITAAERTNGLLKAVANPTHDQVRTPLYQRTISRKVGSAENSLQRTVNGLPSDSKIESQLDRAFNRMTRQYDKADRNAQNIVEARARIEQARNVPKLTKEEKKDLKEQRKLAKKLGI